MERPVLLLTTLLAFTLLVGCAEEPADPIEPGAEGVETASLETDTAALQTEIEGLVQQWEDAFNAADAAGLAAMYTEDARLLPPGGEPLEGRESIQSLFQGSFDAPPAERADLEVTEVYSAGDLAVEEGRATFSSADDAVLDEVKYIVVWKRENGQWKMHHDIWNTNIPPAGS